MKVELLAEAWDTQMTTKNSKSNYFVLDSTGFFFGRFEKNSSPKKLKTQGKS